MSDCRWIAGAQRAMSERLMTLRMRPNRAL
jgi:hypothetical protein